MRTTNQTINDLKAEFPPRPLFVIAGEIWQNWKKPYFGAVPYIRAMYAMSSMDDMYGFDSADSIVRYFLGNATTWRGEKAREIKKELKRMLKSR